MMAGVYQPLQDNQDYDIPKHNQPGMVNSTSMNNHSNENIYNIPKENTLRAGKDKKKHVTLVTEPDQMIYNIPKPNASKLSPGTMPKSCLRKRTDTGAAAATAAAAQAIRVQTPRIPSSQADSETLTSPTAEHIHARFSQHSSLDADSTPDVNYDVPPALARTTPAVVYRSRPASCSSPVTESGVYNVPSHTATTNYATITKQKNDSSSSSSSLVYRRSVPVSPTQPCPPPSLLDCNNIQRNQPMGSHDRFNSSLQDLQDTSAMLAASGDIYDVPCNPSHLSANQRAQICSIVSEGADSGISESRIEEDYDVPKCDIPGEPTCTHKPHTPHSHPPSAYDQRIAPHPTPHPTSHHHDVATPEPPSIDTIPRSRTAHQRRLSYDSLRSAEPSSSSANLKTQSLSSSSLISADTADRVNHRVMADLSMTSRTLSDKQRISEDQLELLSRLGEFTRRSSCRLLSAYRLPSSSRSTALYDLQMACIALRKCMDDFVNFCETLPRTNDLNSLLLPAKQFLQSLNFSINSLDSVSWRFDQILTEESQHTGEQHLKKMVDIAKEIPTITDKLSNYATRMIVGGSASSSTASSSTAQPKVDVANVSLITSREKYTHKRNSGSSFNHKPINTFSDIPSSESIQMRPLPLIPDTDSMLKPQRRSRTISGDRWIDESDYIHFADARKQQSMEEQSGLADKLTYISLQTKPHDVILSVSDERKAPLAPVCTKPATSTYSVSPITLKTDIYDVLPLRSSTTSLDATDCTETNHKTASTTTSNNTSIVSEDASSAAIENHVSSSFERKLRAAQQHEPEDAKPSTTTLATKTETAMLQHYAGQVKRHLAELRVNVDSLIGDVVAGRKADLDDAARAAHKVIYLSDAVSRRVVNLHELGSSLSDKAASMSISLKSLIAIRINVKGEREHFMRAVESMYCLGEHIANMINKQAETNVY